MGTIHLERRDGERRTCAVDQAAPWLPRDADAAIGRELSPAAPGMPLTESPVTSIIEIPLDPGRIAPTPRESGRQATVLAAAVAVFFETGYAEASIEAVASLAGVDEDRLSGDIGSKEDLLLRITERVHERSDAIREDVRAQGMPALGTVRGFVERHVEWYLGNIEELTVFFREWQHLSGHRLERARDRRRGAEAGFRELIEAAKLEGAVAPWLDTRHAARYLLSAMNAVPDDYRTRNGASARAIAERYGAMTVGLLTGTVPRLAGRQLRSAG